MKFLSICLTPCEVPHVILDQGKAVLVRGFKIRQMSNIAVWKMGNIAVVPII